MPIPKHIAQNIIVTLDFDGCIAIGDKTKVRCAKLYHNIDIHPNQITKGTYPLGPAKYKELMAKVTIEHINEYELDPQCKEVLNYLFVQGFRFAVVTSRSGPELEAAKAFSKYHKLPIKYFHATNNNPKDIICKKLCSRAMIDDTFSKLVELLDTPLTLFFLKRIWNENELFNASNNIVSISSWNEFAQRLIELRELHEAVCYYNNWKNNFGSVKQISQFIIENPQLAHDYLRKYNKMVA